MSKAIINHLRRPASEAKVGNDVVCYNCVTTIKLVKKVTRVRCAKKRSKERII